MSEEVLFRTEEERPRTQIAEALRDGAEQIEFGSDRTRRHSVLSLGLLGEYLSFAGLIGEAGWLISHSGQELVAEMGTSPMLRGMAIP